MTQQKAVCKIDGCEKRPRSARSGVCEMHYYRYRRTGSYDLPPKIIHPQCRVSGCCAQAKSSADGYCGKHRERVRKHGDPHVVAPHSNWTGDAATYNAVHLRLRASYGPATKFVCPCGEPAKQWAYQHTSEAELTSELGPYCVDLGHYLAMCVSCHKKMDLGR